jgi:HSP20 family molecular chaperone IbpA
LIENELKASPVLLSNIIQFSHTIEKYLPISRSQAFGKKARIFLPRLS